VHGVLFAPLAELIKLDLAIYFTFIFARPVINSFTVFTCEFYESILCHTFKY
jgi:hypothetical protein